MATKQQITTAGTAVATAVQALRAYGIDHRITLNALQTADLATTDAIADGATPEEIRTAGGLNQ